MDLYRVSKKKTDTFVIQISREGIRFFFTHTVLEIEWILIIHKYHNSCIFPFILWIYSMQIMWIYYGFSGAVVT